jgi:hypothetical protein
LFENISNSEISTAIDEMTASLGVREDVALERFPLGTEEAIPCIEAIARQLGLPIRAVVSYVPKGYRPERQGDDGARAAARFRTAALVNTDECGRGRHGIVAQVSLPTSLPPYGTSSLDGFPIQVLLSEGCGDHPDTFVSVVAHELSHVLLHSLGHPHRQSELHTDLVPILLGFRVIVLRGRKIEVSRATAAGRTTETTRYGYLTDSQFDFAFSKISSLVDRHQDEKEQALEKAAELRKLHQRASQNLRAFRDSLAYLDGRASHRLRAKDAKRIVTFHSLDYMRECEVSLSHVGAVAVNEEVAIRQITHFTSYSLESLRRSSERLNAALLKIGTVSQSIKSDLKVLRRNVGVAQRLRNALQDRFSQPKATLMD